MRGNEYRDALLPGQIDQKLPESVTRHRIDARGRFVEDEQIRLVHDCDCQREALTYAERQG